MITRLRKVGTVTGRGLAQPRPSGRERRAPHCWVTITGASTHNLRDVDTRFRAGDDRGHRRRRIGEVAILGHLPQAEPGTVVIDQRPIRGSRRSNPATFTGMLDPIRRLFAKTTGTPIGLFTANSTGGCTNATATVSSTPTSRSWTVYSPVRSVRRTPVHPGVAGHHDDGVSIADVYEMRSTTRWTGSTRPIVRVLMGLRDVGLGI